MEYIGIEPADGERDGLGGGDRGPGTMKAMGGGELDGGGDRDQVSL
jgi:hypothetical protein